MEVLLLLVSFAIVLTGALIFTNAVEWIGHRLEVGVGAVGSILAAVGTAMPETLIAIVALLDVSEGSEDVAIGAIVGAPFLLATLAMGLVGLFAYLYRDKRDQGVQLNVHRETLERDLVFFLSLFTLAGLLSWGPPPEVRIPVGVAFLLAYVFYIRLTLKGGGEVQSEESLNPLIFERRANYRILTLRQGMEEIVGTLNDVNRAVSTFNPVSREQFLLKVFASLELLDCDRERTTLLVFVDGDQALYDTTANLVDQSKFAERICVQGNIPGQRREFSINTRRRRIAACP